MLRSQRFACLAGLLALLAAPASTSAPPSDKAPALTSLPAWFEPNQGQYEAGIRYFSRGAGGTLFVSERRAMYVTGRRALTVRFEGAGRSSVGGIDALESRSAYLVGNDRSRWRREAPHFARVRAAGVYSGIDVVYHLRGKELEYDFLVHPGADPRKIRVRFEGARGVRLAGSGELIIDSAGGEIRQRAPVAYQETPRGRSAVAASYKLSRTGEVRFALGNYDRSRELVIDPVIYAGYLGGDRNETANAIAVDKEGNVWVTGSSASTVELPSGQAPPLQEAPKGGRDVFLAKMTPDSSGQLKLSYWTQLGGSADDEANDITIDDSGFIYLTGVTASQDFPRAGPAVQNEFGGNTDAFITKLRPEDPNGDYLWFSTFYGAAGTEVANGVAVDSAGNMYIAGYTTSGRLPGTDPGGLQCCNRGGWESFMAKFSPGSATPLAYATLLGGRQTDIATDIAVDAAGYVYFTGYTASDDFPIAGDVYQAELRSGIDIFLARIDLKRPGLDALDYVTFAGGNAMDVAKSMAIDAQGGVWIAGYTLSSDFPVTPDAHRTSLAGYADAFLMRFDLKRPPQDAVTYATYLGGRHADILNGMALVPGGRIALTGYTLSDDFPRVDEPQPGPPKIQDTEVFLTLLDPAKAGAQALVFSTLLGGAYADAGTGVAAGQNGNLFVSGFTRSKDFPVTDGSTKPSQQGFTQSIVLRAAPPAGR